MFSNYFYSTRESKSPGKSGPKMGAEYFWKSSVIQKNKLVVKQLIPLNKSSNKTNIDVQLKSDIMDTKTMWTQRQLQGWAGC